MLAEADDRERRALERVEPHLAQHGGLVALRAAAEDGDDTRSPVACFQSAPICLRLLSQTEPSGTTVASLMGGGLRQRRPRKRERRQRDQNEPDTPATGCMTCATIAAARSPSSRLRPDRRCSPSRSAPLAPSSPVIVTAACPAAFRRRSRTCSEAPGHRAAIGHFSGGTADRAGDGFVAVLLEAAVSRNSPVPAIVRTMSHLPFRSVMPARRRSCRSGRRQQLAAAGAAAAAASVCGLRLPVNGNSPEVAEIHADPAWCRRPLRRSS